MKQKSLCNDSVLENVHAHMRLLLVHASSAVLLLPWIPSASGQKLTLGGVAGTSLTGDFQAPRSYTFQGGTLPDGQTSSTNFLISPVSRSFIVGPELELTVLRALALELDALHRPLHSDVTTTEILSRDGPVLHLRSRSTSSSWEFPVLAKYRFPGHRLRWFIDAGPSLRSAGSRTLFRHWGITAGGGVEIRARGLNILPTIRYTRWRVPSGPVLHPVLDQVEFLVGFDQSGSTEGWATAFGQKICVGVLTGVGLGDDLALPSASLIPTRPDSSSGVWGAVLEIEVGEKWFLEANGIYRPLHATDISQTEGRDVRWAVLTWEFPVLVKYKFRSSCTVRPFAALGPSFRLDGNFNGPTPSHYGATAGAGVEVRAGRLKISPVIRYTRWAQERSPQTPFRASTFLNQAQLLVSFSF